MRCRFGFSLLFAVAVSLMLCVPSLHFYDPGRAQSAPQELLDQAHEQPSYISVELDFETKSLPLPLVALPWLLALMPLLKRCRAWLSPWPRRLPRTSVIALPESGLAPPV